MITHPALHLEIARQRHQDALARAERYRLANASHRSATPRLRFVLRLAELADSVLRRNTPYLRTARDRPCDAAEA